LYCSLSGLTQKVAIFENTNAYDAYSARSTEEQFLCNYGVNPKYQDQIIREPLKVSGIGPDGEIRIIEIPGHRYYVATLFVPQMLSKEGSPHPLILNYLSAAKEFRLS
jgi:CTP synthase (UTP-ammonia lyase)